MTTKVGYQYVILRCVPRVDREEFVNVGVVLYSQAVDYLCAAGHVPAERLRALSPETDIAAVERAIDAITKICCGDQDAGAPARTSLSQRFGWIAAPKSTVVQPGPIHGGLTDEPRSSPSI